MEIGWLLLYIAMAVLAVLSGDRAGSLVCSSLRRRCGRTPLLHLPAWMRVGIGLAIPVIGMSGIVWGTAGIYGKRSFWMLTHHSEIIALCGFFTVGVLTSIFVGGFCSRRQ